MDALIELTSKVFEVPISDARSKVIRALAESSDPLDCLNKLRRTNHWFTYPALRGIFIAL